MNEYVIYTRWLAYELRKAGYRILRTEVNPNKPQYDCWVFEESDGFYNSLLKLTKKK